MFPKSFPRSTAGQRMGAVEWVLLLFLAALWGGSFFFFKILVGELPPFTVVLGRVGFAALLLQLYLLARRDPMPFTPRLWCRFLAMGLLNNAIPFTLIVYGETRISSGLAAILNAMTPVFGVVVAHLLTTTEKLTWARGAGVLLGLCGVIVLIGPDALTDAHVRGDARQQALILQHAQRLAHRMAADAEAVAQLEFSRKPSADGMFARRDLVGQDLAELFIAGHGDSKRN